MAPPEESTMDPVIVPLLVCARRENPAKINKTATARKRPDATTNDRIALPPARPVIPKNAGKRLRERNLGKDRLNRISPPKRHRPRNKPPCFVCDQISNSSSPSKRSMKFCRPSDRRQERAHESSVCNRFQKPVT